MRSEPADPAFNRPNGPGRRGHAPPSAGGYLVVSLLVAVTLSLIVWSVLHETNEEATWAAALAACVVLLVAASARELIVRRAWSRQLLDTDGRVRPDSLGGRGGGYASAPNLGVPRAGNNAPRNTWSHSAALRAVQKRSAEAEASNAPDLHWDAYRLSQEYLATTDEALRAVSLATEKRIAMRAGQERVRGLGKFHLLAWARSKAQAVMYEAQNFSRVHDRLDTARRALQVLETARTELPNERELEDSTKAIREFMASARVRHWLEMAERAAFRGHPRRAIARYRDTLFYVRREIPDTALQTQLVNHIESEIARLKEKIANASAWDEATHTATPPSEPTREA